MRDETAIVKSSTLLKLAGQFFVTIALVIFCSAWMVRMWGGKPEKVARQRDLVVSPTMTLAEWGRQNEIPNRVLMKAFRFRDPSDLEQPLGELGMEPSRVKDRVGKMLVIYAEEGSKNWKKILAKFTLWLVFLSVLFLLVRTSRVTRRTRKPLYLAAIIIFGVILGADPSPMGTVKDAIVLYGRHGVIFPPRMIALTVFLLSVLLANKFICSWGCQLGVLQDFLFRLNRNSKDTKAVTRQFKPPFLITNTIRALVFVLFTVVAFAWSVDLIGWIDPFKIFDPRVVRTVGWVFIVTMLLSSLFIYRPWCHLFCPFGLVGWAVEQFSLFKVKVDHNTCTACGACARACPSLAMDAIVKGKAVIPDCFSCSSCIDVCPTRSISFGTGKREKPPAGQFDEHERDAS